jgi:hypothetical protein
VATRYGRWIVTDVAPGTYASAPRTTPVTAYVVLATFFALRLPLSTAHVPAADVTHEPLPFPDDHVPLTSAPATAAPAPLTTVTTTVAVH